MNEVEITLIIVSENPQRVSEEISELSELAGLTVVPLDSQHIQDLYFDTSDLQLKDRLLSLRLRYVNGKSLVTFKGPPKINQTGVVERFELESSWSSESLHTAIHEVKSRGIDLVDSSESTFHVDPRTALLNLGFQVIQNRESHRTVRNLYKVFSNASPIAELVIDDLFYHFNDEKVRHHELEIELKSQGSSKLLSTLTSSLIEKFGSVLKPWEHSKLVTGLAVRELMQLGELDDDIGPDYNLMPKAYEKIKKFLDAKAT